MDKLIQHIEAIIFSSEQPIPLKEIKGCLEQSMETSIKKDLLEQAMEQLLGKYCGEEYAFEVVRIADGYQFLTKGAYHHTIGTLLKQKAKKRLSRAALETLSIIAYKQPVTKSAAERIRGVSCDYAIQKLLEKELIVIAGRSEGPGRPLLYVTSEKFMNYFGLKSIKDLPKPKDFKQEENSIGQEASIEETVQNQAKDEKTEK
jgi:segregation and condensation protein B